MLLKMENRGFSLCNPGEFNLRDPPFLHCQKERYILYLHFPFFLFLRVLKSRARIFNEGSSEALILTSTIRNPTDLGVEIISFYP